MPDFTKADLCEIVDVIDHLDQLPLSSEATEGSVSLMVDGKPFQLGRDSGGLWELLT